MELHDWTTQFSRDLGRLREDTEKGQSQIRRLLRQLEKEALDIKTSAAGALQAAREGLTQRVQPAVGDLGLHGRNISDIKQGSANTATLLRTEVVEQTSAQHVLREQTESTVVGSANTLKLLSDEAQDVLTEEVQSTVDKLRQHDQDIVDMKQGMQTVVQRLDELEKKINRECADEALTEAIASQDMSALRLAMRQAKNTGLDVSSAEAILEEEAKANACELMEEALAPKDIAKLDTALAAAKGAGLGQDGWGKIEKAINAIKHTQKQEQGCAEQAMTEAIASQDVSALRLAMRQAKNTDLIVSNAETILEDEAKANACELMEEALAPKDIAKLDAALAAAKGTGLGQDEWGKIEKAINAIKHTQKQEQGCAEQALTEAIASQDVSALRLAMRQAKNTGLDVSNAQAILEEEAAKTKACELMEEALGAKDIAKLDAALAAAKGAGLGQDEWGKIEKAINAIKHKQEQEREEAKKREAACGSMRQAAKAGDTACLRNLLKDFPECKDEADADGRTPTYNAAWQGQIGALSVLVKTGADLNKAKTDGVTPAYVAAEGGCTEALKVLVQARADVDKATRAGSTLAAMAAEKGHARVLQVLAQARANLGNALPGGRTPAHFAAWKGHAEVLKVLAEAGADLNGAHQCRGTPAHSAAALGRAEALKILVRAGADVNRADACGSTPAWTAARHGHAEALRVLVQARADLQRANNDGMTPVGIAQQWGNASALAVLGEAGAMNASVA